MDKRVFRRWLALMAAGAFATLLSACGGDDGATGPQGPPGPPGPVGTTSVDVTTIPAEAWANSTFRSEVTSVVVASPPVVTFTVVDDQGLPVVGLEKVSTKAPSDTIARYPNVSFAIAKLIPSDANNPSEWKSYIVTSVNRSTGALSPTRPSTDSEGTLEAVADTPGTYKYTFFRDVPNTAAIVDGFTYSGNNRRADLGDVSWQPALPHRLTIQISGAAPGTGTNTPTGVQTTAAVNMANPVNVIYDFKPGAAGQPGTAIPPDQLTREDVNIASCNVCHEKLAFHGGSARVETRYCVVCHTEQRAFGQAQATSSTQTLNPGGGTQLTFPKLTETKTVNPTTGITSYSYSPQTAVADGEVAGNFTTMIHKIHQGNWLVKDNYNYANLPFNKKGFSKLGGGQRMCSTCHDSNIASTASNHKEKPTRVSCGACHDGINWATGGGSTLADKQNASYPSSVLAQSGHEGRAQADDSKCALCHTPTYVPYDHRMENITKNNPGVLPGLASFKYDIQSAAVNSTTNDVTIVFRVLKGVSPVPPAGSFLSAPADADYTPVTFVAPAASVSNPLAGFTGSPAFLLAYATSQDGITTPSDFTNSQTIRVNNVDTYVGIKQQQPISVSIAQLLSTNNAATIGTMSGPDGNGYYTATIKGSGTAVCGNSDTRVKCSFPTGAKMRTVALQAYFTQLNAPTDNVGGTGSVARHAISVVKTVTGDTPRRTIVDQEKCSNCHEWFEGHGGNRVKETQVCVMCHNTGLATSGRGITDTVLAAYNANTAANVPTANTGAFSRADRSLLADWTFVDLTKVPNTALQFPVTSNNFKDMIHGIHAGRDRVTPFQDARDRSPGTIQLLDFRRMDFPGKLNNCETCHVTANSTATTYNTVPPGALVSTHESRNQAYFDATQTTPSTATTVQARTSLNTANAQDSVTTPFAAACVSCHDSSAAKAHIDISGGSILARRDVAQKANRPLEDVESCAVCHGPGRSVDAAVVHK